MSTLAITPPRLSTAGDDKPTWITVHTTEHYNPQTQRAAPISEANGRASIFLGALSAGLIALGSQDSAAGRSAGRATLEVLVLSSLSFLGLVTFLRSVEIGTDDWQSSRRISAVRAPTTSSCPSSQRCCRPSPAMSSRSPCSPHDGNAFS